VSLDPGQVLDLFTFVVGPHRYAIDVRRVDEVLAPAEVTPLPGARAPVDGLLSLRGGPVPRVDLRLCLPAGDPPAGSEPRVLLCWLGRRRVAFYVDGVGGVTRVPAARLQVAPGGPVVPPAVVAVSVEGGAVHFLLDLVDLLHRQSPPAPAPG
jgi:purine-binding chemotaxis protein CheW